MEKYRINPISGEIVPIYGNRAENSGGYLGNEGSLSAGARNVLGDFIPETGVKNSIAADNYAAGRSGTCSVSGAVAGSGRAGGGLNGAGSGNTGSASSIDGTNGTSHGAISGKGSGSIGSAETAVNGYDFEVGAETTKPIAERGRSEAFRRPENVPAANADTVGTNKNPAIGGGHTTEKQRNSAHGDGYSTEKQRNSARGDGYSTEKQRNSARGGTYTGEKQKKPAFGETDHVKSASKSDGTPRGYADETLETVHPGDPVGGENIPPTAPSRQTIPKVPNRAWTQMCVGGSGSNGGIGGFGGISDEGDGGEESGENGEKASQTDKKDRTVTTRSGDKLIKTIVIAGQIEGHSQLPQGQKATRYEELIPQLVEIEEDDEIGGLLLILNTVGGDVEAGLALSELIAGMKKPTASLVLGGGHSIGVPLAVSAKRSFIVPSATMTLHPVRITGMVLGAPQTYVYMSRMQSRIVDFTCSHCNMTPERFNELMLSRDEMSTDLGSVLDGGQAVREGLIDSLGALSDAIEFLKSAATETGKRM